MNYLLSFLYMLAVRLGDVYIFAGSFFSHKLKLLCSGRKNSFGSISKFSENNIANIWVHCASLGEFEQGRPIIEFIKTHFPEKKIALSFFSPSGYEYRKNYPLADLVFYLPSDRFSNNNYIVQALKPELVIFIKYEFWWNLIDQLIHRDIPVYLVSGIFRPNDYFFKPFFIQYLHLLRRYEKIFVQDQQSMDVLNVNKCDNAVMAGDTRVDSVIRRSGQIDLPERIIEMVGSNKVIIYGSIYTSDMQIINSAIEAFPDFIHILAPHDISQKNIAKIQLKLMSSASLYSKDNLDSEILIIDNIGMLFQLYSVATYVYIGGGFQKGIHNILEPAVFKIPVFFGPKYKKFAEAVTMIKLESAFEVSNGPDLIRIIAHLDAHSEAYLNVRDKAAKYFSDNEGATAKIGDYLRHIIRPEL